nr:hypothetical protein [Bacteroidales bacterium]
LYQPSSESIVGKIAKLCLDQVTVDKAFIGIDGYTSESGFMLKDLFRAEISTHIIQRSKDVTIVTDSSKFGKTGLTSICSLQDIKRIATDLDMDPKYREEFSMAGVELLMA